MLLRIAAVLAVALNAAAQNPLSLAEAQRLAEQRSQQLAAQDLGAAASREMALSAARLPDPVLQLGIENVPVEGADKWSLTRDFMTMRRVGVMQELTRKEKRSARAERFEAEAQKSLTEKEAMRAQIRRDTALAWMDAWYAEAMAGVVAQMRVRGLQEAQAAESEYRAGRGGQADVFMVRTSVAMLDDRAAEVERKVRTARTLLARWTGVEDRPLGDKPFIGRVDPRAHGSEEELARHPQIAVLLRQEQLAAAEARVAAAARDPDWTVGLAYNVRGSAFGDMVSVGVSVPLPWDRANRQDREVAARLAMVEQARAQREEAVRQHVAEVRAMAHEWDSDRRRLLRYEGEIIPLAENRSQAAAAAYRAGKSTLSDVLAAQRAELETRLAALQLEAGVARLWTQLNFLTAEETP
jgi:outer membrane protein TolC